MSVFSEDSQHHYSAPAGSQSKKRKRTSVVRTSDSTGLTQDPAPQHSHAQVADPPLVQRTQSTIPPSELPEVSPVVHPFQPSTAPLLDDGPLIIHHRSMYKNGHQHPYRIALGRLIKQKLWELSDRPQFTETVDDNGLVHVNISYRARVYPPLYDVDKSYEPQPQTSPRKRRLKAPKTGVSTEGGEDTAASWPWFELMDEALGERPNITPPCLIASAGQDAAVSSPPSATVTPAETPCSSPSTSSSATRPSTPTEDSTSTAAPRSTSPPANPRSQGSSPPRRGRRRRRPALEDMWQEVEAT
ncbi:uncharacterized protein LOC117812951 isoform X1 [Xyrichtys novacula]|uniref:Uncharacterized protein LOC117812951 isoform X1 n=1 Tax=Xyrichtys novacula TaxID=13765 RepID=A0AAV1FWX4_XYRNO|nr:uncharacterized protein LOC117812951 isoform X1 [Xyrichtys novacula]